MKIFSNKNDVSYKVVELHNLEQYLLLNVIKMYLTMVKIFISGQSNIWFSAYPWTLTI